jgi:hypothetical protein
MKGDVRLLPRLEADMKRKEVRAMDSSIEREKLRRVHT